MASIQICRNFCNLAFIYVIATVALEVGIDLGVEANLGPGLEESRLKELKLEKSGIAKPITLMGLLHFTIVLLSYVVVLLKAKVYLAYWI